MNARLTPLSSDYPLPPREHRQAVHERLRAKMDEDGLDAVVLTSAENFYYAVGSPSSLSYLLPISGVSAIAVAWRADERLTVIINDFEGLTFPYDVLGYELLLTAHWSGIETGDEDDAVDEQPPTSLDGGETFQRLAAVLQRLPTSARVGVDLPQLQAAPLASLRQAAAGREVVDATRLINSVRAIKTPWEIANLRMACEVTEAAITSAAALIRPGITEQQLKTCHDGAITSSPTGARVRLSGISIGHAFSIRAFPSTRAGLPGELVRFDCGAHILEYGADIARVFAIGHASDQAKEIYSVLSEVQQELVAKIAPGVAMSALFDDALRRIRDSGLPRYRRGHLGHSVGVARCVEEPPLFASGETALLEPGMVLSVEVPHYSVEVGALNIEDMVLVTDDGCELISTLPRELIEIG